MYVCILLDCRTIERKSVILVPLGSLKIFMFRFNICLDQFVKLTTLATQKERERKTCDNCSICVYSWFIYKDIYSIVKP